MYMCICVQVNIQLIILCNLRENQESGVYQGLEGFQA